MGYLTILNGRVFRMVRSPYKSVTLQLIQSEFFKNHCNLGDFPLTKVPKHLPVTINKSIDKSDIELTLEHNYIPFPVYPHEWTPNMLYDAGELTLDLANDAFSNKLIIKDATPWNILYSDGRPIFCDIMSFITWSGCGIWDAYAQFQRTFILPLYAHNKHAWQIHSIFIDNRDGLTPQTLSSAITGLNRWSPFELQTIILPAKLSFLSIAKMRNVQNIHIIKKEKFNNDLEKFILLRSLNRLRRQLNKVKPKEDKISKWSHYEMDLQHYDNCDHEKKRSFVYSGLLRAGRGRVLDIGANSGEYSLIAASQGNPVLAADVDVAALDKLYLRAKANKLPITPVVFNIARPTPAVGWANREIDSFLKRAKGKFNVVMVLALLHHLIVTERIPLELIIKLLYDLNAKYLIIEWIQPNDPRFKQIALTHGDLYKNISGETFEQELKIHFNVLERLTLNSKTRVLYLCERNK